MRICVGDWLAVAAFLASAVACGTRDTLAVLVTSVLWIVAYAYHDLVVRITVKRSEDQ